MDSEAKSVPLQFRAEMLANVRKYRREVNSLQTQFTKARVDRRKDSFVNVGFTDVNVPVQDQHRQQNRCWQGLRDWLGLGGASAEFSRLP